MTPGRQDWYNLGEIFRLPQHGERIVYIDLRDENRERRFTAVELDRLIDGVARGLLRRGIVAAERVGILAANRVEFVASYFGIMRCGAVAVPVNHKLPPATISHIFTDSGIHLAFCDGARRRLVPGSVPAIDFDSEGSDGFAPMLDLGSFESFAPDATDLAQILYTSGSTGVPKGVPLTHRGQLWALEHYMSVFQPDPPSDTTIVVAPLYHMNGLFFTSVALANRMTVISLPRFDARRYLEIASRHRCTVLSGIPTMFALMVREHDLISRLDFSHVREVMIGSAPMTDMLQSQVQALFSNARVRNGFGTTEAGPAVFGPHPAGIETPTLSVGYPMEGIGCQLIDGPSTNQGVLALQTPALMSGYLNLPDLTAARVRDGWYITGDVMRRDVNGFYYFVGRADDMFVCGGENIYPGEIEMMLERHPDVAQAVVVATPDDIKGQIPVAFIVRRRGASASAEQIKAYALEHGPVYAHPRFVEFREILPVSGTHKIDRTSLTEAAATLARAAGRSH